MTQGSAGTNGFLFCDLRGYTAFVERCGDQAAVDLLATYRALVRTAIATHAGAEIKTEGDSVYVVFPAASAAVAAGLEIVAAAAEQSTKDAPIRVGVGVHAGETVATTEGLVGGAVNIAARVCAKAQAGEVLVTDTVRALTRTYLPYRYTSLGTQQLKGIAGGIPLYRVEAVPSSGRARLARQLGARRGRLTVLAGLVVIAIIAATGVYALNRPPDCLNLPASTKDVVAKIDPARNCVVAVYPVGQRPASVVFSDATLWIANRDDETLTWIEPQTLHTGTTAAGGLPVGLAMGPGSVMALDLGMMRGTAAGNAQFDTLVPDLVAQISNGQRRWISTPVRLPSPNLPGTGVSGLSGYQAVAFVADHGWVTDSLTGRVIRVNLEDQTYVAIQVEPPVPTTVQGHSPTYGSTGLGPIAAGGGVVWVANELKPTIYVIEGNTARPISLDGEAGSVALEITESAIWLARGDGRLTRVNPVTSSPTSFDVGARTTAIAVDATAVWAADLLGRTVRRVDAESGTVLATIKVGGRPAGVAIAPDGSVWATIQGP